MDAKQFTREIDEYVDETIDQFVELHKKIALSAFKMVTVDSRRVGFAHGSPVWTGWFMSGHRISVNTPDRSSPPPHDEIGALNWPDEPDSGVLKAMSMSEAAAKLIALKPFDVVYITNSTPHATKLEEGYSPKAPEGIYGLIPDKIVTRFRNVKL